MTEDIWFYILNFLDHRSVASFVKTSHYHMRLLSIHLQWWQQRVQQLWNCSRQPPEFANDPSTTFVRLTARNKCFSCFQEHKLYMVKICQQCTWKPEYRLIAETYVKMRYRIHENELALVPCIPLGNPKAPFLRLYLWSDILAL